LRRIDTLLEDEAVIETVAHGLATVATEPAAGGVQKRRSRSSSVC